MRINKFLSSNGVCSRRAADALIEEGRITVNGKSVSNGMQVEEGDEVCLDGLPVKKRDTRIYLKMNKPKGIVCTAEKREKNNIIDFMKYPERLTYAGRLDKDSQGLLIMTNDGDLINSLMRARNKHEKEYSVTVDRPIDREFIEKMGKGVYLPELEVTTRECFVKQTGKKTFTIVLTQGLNRQIRRMCQACGYRVVQLKRVRICNVLLEDLKVGEYRELREDERDELFRTVEVAHD